MSDNAACSEYRNQRNRNGRLVAVPALHFKEAHACVQREVARHFASKPRTLSTEAVSLEDCDGRVLSEDVRADRDSPPVPRSTRDGFAVRAADFPGRASVIGEVRAGSAFNGSVGAAQAVEIMTGAPLPMGADAVIMVEHASLDSGWITTDRTVAPGQFINRRASEYTQGEAVLEAGHRIDFSSVALLAAVGSRTVPVFSRPRVAIVSTGDEVVGVETVPLDYQVRNSNAYSLAAQVRRAGGRPAILPVATDDLESTRAVIRRGLQSQLLLLSGGVSAGKYDIVETVLSELGAEFYFDRVWIQPGQPLVFGRVADTFVFGLPGNPASTIVTFALFARTAIELIGGQVESPLPLLHAHLSADFRHKPGLTRFLPAWLSTDGWHIAPVTWQGSSDIAALARANAFLVADHDREIWNAGDLIKVLPK